MYKLRIVLRNIIVFTACLLPCTYVYAGSSNPATGDTVGRYIWVVVVIAAVALVAAIVSALVGKKGKKK